MSKSLDLSDSVYAALEEAASASGTTPEGWIAVHLQKASALLPESEGFPAECSPTAQPSRDVHPPRTLADEFAGRVGLFSSGRSDLSERVSELFADGMEEKHREGRL